MKLIPRFAVNYINKHFPRQKETVIKYIRTYAGATMGRLLGDWLSTSLSANEEIKTSIKTVRERARQLERDNPYIKKYLELQETNLVGHDGIRLNLRIKNNSDEPEKRMNDLIEAEWKKWSKKGSCDVSGKLSWIDVQNLIVRNWKRDGEAILRIISPWDRNDFNFAVQVIEADLLDEELDVLKTEDGTRIRMGIELDQWDWPINYWFLTSHPGGIRMQGKQYNVIPAQQIMHIYKQTRAGMVRGISQIHASMNSTHNLEQYEEAELVSARIRACVVMALKRTTTDFQGDEKPFKDGAQKFEFAPGRIWDLPDGQEATMFDPGKTDQNYSFYTKSLIRKIASGLDISYESLASDLEGVTFSSIRSGKIEERDQFKKDQNFIEEHLCDPVFIAWVMIQLLLGNFGNVPASRLKNIIAGLNWSARRWLWVDPLKDAQAAEIKKRNGWISDESVAQEEGRDIEEEHQEQVMLDEFDEEIGFELPPPKESTVQDSPERTEDIDEPLDGELGLLGDEKMRFSEDKNDWLEEDEWKQLKELSA